MPSPVRARGACISDSAFRNGGCVCAYVAGACMLTWLAPAGSLGVVEWQMNVGGCMHYKVDSCWRVSVFE